ncbi:MAG TPA: hypothetical protein DET40_04665 [Lentisphaeria bacterium]|nr:MAG: hypothetical protein A2X45_21460 [Lentisphaerae bacterium GWF2_50_93]HCE42817.1 hypothetical protein [Lentisphaeria bacterium]
MTNSKITEKAQRRRCRNELLRILKKEARFATKYRRLLCEGLKPHLSPAKIASVLSLDVQTVRNNQSAFNRRGGAKALIGGKRRGGRRRSNMSRDDELKLLLDSCSYDKRRRRDMVLFQKLKSNYEKKGNPVAPSTIYRLLERHGCHRKSSGVYTSPRIFRESRKIAINKSINSKE